MPESSTPKTYDIFVKNIPGELARFLFDKQNDFAKEKLIKPNMSRTIIRLLTEAYLPKKKP